MQSSTCASPLSCRAKPQRMRCFDKLYQLLTQFGKAINLANMQCWRGLPINECGTHPLTLLYEIGVKRTESWGRRRVAAPRDHAANIYEVRKLCATHCARRTNKCV